MSLTNNSIKVCLTGARGKVGSTLARTLPSTQDIQVRIALDVQGVGQSLQTTAGPSAPDILVESDLAAALKQEAVDVLVDFSHPTVAAHHALTALQHRVAPIIGTSGLKPQEIEQIRESCLKYETPALIVPNFAIGSILSMKLAELVARWLPQVEIIEYHHDQKADAPSGTALRTAQRIAAARKNTSVPQEELITVEGVRGGRVEEIPVHSVRLKGIMARQDIIFGGNGETLVIQHNAIDRTIYLEGVKLAIRKVRGLQGLVIGLESILFEKLNGQSLTII
jgi:4-hydroxy-tetrahydrodipicolinate reductase